MVRDFSNHSILHVRWQLVLISIAAVPHSSSSMQLCFVHLYIESCWRSTNSDGLRLLFCFPWRQLRKRNIRRMQRISFNETRHAEY